MQPAVARAANTQRQPQEAEEGMPPEHTDTRVRRTPSDMGLSCAGPLRHGVFLF